jgi:hypothetical protein
MTRKPPWAKFENKSMEYTKEYPTAMRAYMEPKDTPFMSCWASVSNGYHLDPAFSFKKEAE